MAIMFHVLQYMKRLVYQFVALSAMYVHHHAYATSVVLVMWLIKPV